MPPALRRRAPLAVLLVATLAALAVGLRNGFVWDDAQLIVANDAPLSLGLVRDAFARHFWDTAGYALAGRAHFYRPVVTLAYAFTRALFGAGPFGFHLVNLGVHLAVVALAFDHVRRRLGPDAAAPLAAAAGVALFALHPARAESVAWAAGAPDLWAALFALVALRLDPARRPLPAALAFALALLSKEAVAFIPIALVVDALCLRPAAERRAALRGPAVLFAVLGAVFVVRAVVLPRGSAQIGHAAVPRVLASLGYLLARTFAPWPLTVWSSRLTYDATPSPIYPAPYVAIGTLFLVAVVLVALLAYRRAALLPFAADVAWFALALLPVANPLDLGLSQLIADRYLYLPHLALAALLARALLVPLRRPVIVLAPVAVAVALGVLASMHARQFHDEEALWRHEVAVDADNPIARLSLARALASRHRYGEALALAQRALVSAHAQNARAIQMDGVLLATAILLDGLPDADQRALTSTRTFLDGLGNHPGQPAQLDAGGLRMSLLLGRDDAARVRAMTLDWQLPLADAALLTLAPLAARDQYLALQRRLPNHPRPYAGAALALALMDDIDAALQGIARAPAFVAPRLARLRARLASPACADHLVSDRTRKVRCALALDQREQARRIAAQPPGETLDPELVTAIAVADVRDGLCRRARRRLDLARTAAPTLDLGAAERAVAGCRAFVPREE